MTYIELNAGWYVIAAIFIVSWLSLAAYRKDYRMKPQLLFGMIGVAVSFVVENIAAYFGLWSYDGGSWPAMLWVAYFFTSLALYQAAKLVSGKSGK